MEAVGAHVAGGSDWGIGAVLTCTFQKTSIVDTMKSRFQGAAPTQPTAAQIENLKSIIKALEIAYDVESIEK